MYNYKLKFIILPFLLLILQFFLFSSCEKKYTFATPSEITIGTGDITGNYYLTGTILGKIINSNSEKSLLKLNVEATDGSVNNINNILSGKNVLGIVQSDRQYQAYYGIEEWEKSGPQKNLRSIISLYTEAITLVVTEQSNIQEIQDIKGKKINLGHEGSGQLNNSKEILSAYSIKEKDIIPHYLRPLESITAIKKGEIDGFFYTIGHPSTTISNLSKEIKIKMISLYGKEIDDVLQKYPYYTKSIIPANLYPHLTNTRHIPTIGVEATLVTSNKVDPKIIYQITKDIHENLEQIQNSSTIFQNLSSEGFLEGLSAPIHPGSYQYFNEKKLIQIIPDFLKPKS